MAGGTELLDQESAGCLRRRRAPTREHIDRGVAVFRPGVDRHVRFSQQRQGRDPLRLELMAHQLQEGGHAVAGGLIEGMSNERLVIEQMGVASVQLQDAMRA